MKTLRLVAICFLLSGCAMVVPVHEADPPENLDNWGFRIGMIMGTAPEIAPKTAFTSNETTEMAIDGFRIAFGFLERFQVNLDAFAGIDGGGSSVALKYQWTGDTYFKAKKGNSSQVTTLRSWSGVAADLSLDYQDGTHYGHSDLTGHGVDVSHIWGQRLTDYFGFFAGPKLIYGKIEGEYRNDKDGPVQKSDARTFFGGGGVGGLFLSPHGPHAGFDLTAELSAMNLPKTYSNDRAFYTTLMLMLAFPFSFN